MRKLFSVKSGVADRNLPFCEWRPSFAHNHMALRCSSRHFLPSSIYSQITPSKDKKKTVRLPSSLSASSNRTAHNEVYTCGATPTRQNLETISRVIGSEERVCTATFLRNTTPSQPVMNLESGSKRK